MQQSKMLQSDAGIRFVDAHTNEREFGVWEDKHLKDEQRGRQLTFDELQEEQVMAGRRVQ